MKPISFLFYFVTLVFLISCGGGGDISSSNSGSGSMPTNASRALSLAAITPTKPDSFNSLNNQLTITAVQVGTTTFTNVVITVGSVVSVGSGVASGQVDLSDSSTNQLTIPSVIVGSTTYNNVVITVGSVISVGGTSDVTLSAYRTQG